MKVSDHITIEGHGLETVAIVLATLSHASQKRKDGVTPYVTHLYRVAERTRERLTLYSDLVRPNRAQTVATAYLHDILEDTDVAVGDLTDVVGSTVTRAVSLLTRRYGETYETYIERIIDGVRRYKEYESDDEAPIIAAIVKICDIEDHLTWRPHEPHTLRTAKARRYVESRDKLFDALQLRIYPE